MRSYQRASCECVRRMLALALRGVCELSPRLCASGLLRANPKHQWVLVGISLKMQEVENLIRVKISKTVWLSACGKCREVLAFGETLESLKAAELAHICPDPRDAALVEPEAA